MSSTIVMAPMRNTTISQVSPRASTMSVDREASWPSMAYTAQSMPHIIRAKVALLMPTTCSRAIIR